MRKRIYLSPPHIGGNEQRYVQEVIASNWVAPVGPDLTAFENELAQYTKSKHVAAVTSGTAAIHLALRLLGVDRGDEVIVPSFTFVATANPIIYEQATPVFVGSEGSTWNMSPQHLEEAIQDGLRRGKQPKAVIVVHLYGMPAQMEQINRICSRYEIPIIEDAAEALGSHVTIAGARRMLGSIGKFGILSFNGNKIITTSGGGALLSDEQTLIEQARYLATQGRDPAPHYQHSTLAYNYRLSNVLAGIGRAQLEQIDHFVAKRRENFNFYRKRFASGGEISFPLEPEGYFSNRWLTTMLISMESRVTPEDLRLALEESNIEARPLWKPLHLQPLFEGCRYYSDHIEEKLFQQGLCLPSGSDLKQEELELICSIVEEVWEARKCSPGSAVSMSSAAL